MARNTEVVWQWEILRSIDAATQGVTVTKLAAERGVRERTIRRDLDALGRAARGRYLRTRSKPPKMLAHAS
jgi:DeoR/GlpR family transcriptional regulator of sugar metabolism